MGGGRGQGRPVQAGMAPAAPRGGLQVVAQARPVRLAAGQAELVAGEGDQGSAQPFLEAVTKFARSPTKRASCARSHGRSA